MMLFAPATNAQGRTQSDRTSECRRLPIDCGKLLIRASQNYIETWCNGRRLPGTSA